MILALFSFPSNNLSNVFLWIIPLLSGLTTFFTSKLSAKQMEANGNDVQQAASMQKNMTLVLPIMTTYISFIVPLGMGLYWLVNNTVSVISQQLINKYIYSEKKNV